MKRTHFLPLFILILFFMIPCDLFGIPAFARKYNTTCKTCHNPFPYLKDYGDEFAANGFVLKDQEAPRYFVDTGDPLLSLIRDFPIAARLEAFVTYNNGHSEQPDFATPYLLKFLSGGAIAKDVAYYFYFFFDERGEVAGIEDAYLMFNNLLGSELDVYVGQFQVSDPLFKRELRLTYEDYLIYKTDVGRSSANLTYDKGLMLTYGFETGTDVIFEVVNGNGIGAANAAHLYDNDKYKNFIGRVSQGIGENFRLGAFGYYGKEEQDDAVNKTYYAGADFSLTFNKIELNVQYLKRNDDNPFFLGNNSFEIDTEGGLVELIYRPEGDESRHYFAGLFNWIQSGLNILNAKKFTAHFGYLMSRNIRLVTEYTHDFTNEYGRAGIGFIAAF